jgi:hypothetical protein
MMSGCCGLPHDPRIPCVEILWAASAPTEDEAYRRASVIAERIKGAPLGDDPALRERFRRDVQRRARRGSGPT